MGSCQRCQNRTGRTRGIGREPSGAGHGGTPAVRMGTVARKMCGTANKRKIFENRQQQQRLRRKSQAWVWCAYEGWTRPVGGRPQRHEHKQTGTHLGDVVALDVAHAVQRHKARKGNGEVVPQAQDLAALTKQVGKRQGSARQDITAAASSAQAPGRMKRMPHPPQCQLSTRTWSARS